MAEVKVKEIQTLNYERPAIQKGYANQTLYVDLAASQISIKPVNEKMKEIFVGGKGFDLWFLWNAVKRGDLATARQLQDRIMDVCELLILNPRCFQSACKLVLQKRGIFSTTINTHPLPALDPDYRKLVLARGRELGLF